MHLVPDSRQEHPATANDDAQNIAADVDEVMRKYDRESNTRIWSGWQAVVIKVFMAAFALLCICMTLFSTAMPEIRLPRLHGLYRARGLPELPGQQAPREAELPAVVRHPPDGDRRGLLLLFALNAMTMIKLATRIQPIHVVIGCIGILVLVELCRRCVGLPILVVASLGRLRVL